jgi:flavin-dependent dehydrogenase
MDDMYDVIIAGGSFAGLTTARFTEAERILIIEKEKDIGAKQRSTCAAPLSWIKRLGDEKSILHEINSITFHSHSGDKARIRIRNPFCTIDYGLFCKSLGDSLENTDILTDQRVISLTQGYPKTVKTDKGTYKGKVVVDASGWRAVTAASLGYPDHWKGPYMATAMEQEADWDSDDSLHIFYNNDLIPGGYAWVFPIGKDRARIGLGSFGKVKLKAQQEKFMDFLGVDAASAGKPHGGRIPCGGLKEPVLGDVFMVGDAAGQCLPVTAEGIRPAFENAQFLGSVITKLLSDEIVISKAVKEYRTYVNSQKKFYSNLLLLQRIIFHSPNIVMDRVTRMTASKPEMFEKIPLAYFNRDIDQSTLDLMLKGMRYLGLRK